MTDPLDLSGQLLPPVVYFPHPSLVPNRLVMNTTEPLTLADLRQLGACADEGLDAVYAMVGATPELSTDPDDDAETIVVGGVTLTRAVIAINDARIVSWHASVTGLTFRTDDAGRVYVDGPDGRVVLHDPAHARWGGKAPGATVYASEEPGPLDAANWAGHRPSGKSKRYATYADMVRARNASRRSRTHGVAPDAILSVLGMAPMIDKRKPTTTIVGEDRTEPDGLMTRRVGRRYTLRLDDATAKRLHGERGGSKQAVLRYDAKVEANEADVGHAAMQLLREFDAETLFAVIGLTMEAFDRDNETVRIGAADLARIRGKELERAKDKAAFRAMSELLANAAIEVYPVGGDGGAHRLELFAKQGVTTLPGGARVPLVTLNDVLYRAMRAKGHGIVIDRRLLTIDLNAHEWEGRLDAALCGQWSLGWVRDGYGDGKRLRRKAKQLLLEAGIPYDFKAERAKRGAAVVRMKVRGVLDRLVGLGLDLKSWRLAKEGDDPADDTYEFVPSDALVSRMTTHRQPGIASKQRRAMAAKPTTGRKPRRG